MLYAVLSQDIAEHLRGFNGNGTHQDRLAFLVALNYILEHSIEFSGFGLKDHIGVVNPDHRKVGGYGNYVQFVDGAELLFLGKGRTGHARQLAVHPEIVLECDGGKCLALPLNLHTFFCLNGLVQPIAVPAPIHEPSGKFVNNNYFPSLDDVVHVFFHEPVGFQGLVDVVGNSQILNIGKVFNTEVFLGLFNAPGCQGGGMRLLVNNIIRVYVIGKLPVISFSENYLFKPPYQSVGSVIQFGGLFPLPGNNKRGPGLVYEDGVHLVHNGIMQIPLYHLLLVNHHVVTKVVKSKLIVGTIGYIAIIGLSPGIVVQAVDDNAHRKPEKVIDLAHEFGLVLCQVIVHGHKVGALAFKGIQIKRKGCRKCFTFTSFHLGNPSLMEYDTTHQLDPVMPFPDDPCGGLSHYCIGFGKYVIQGFTVNQALFKPVCHFPEFGVGHGLHLRLQCFYSIHEGHYAL